MNKNLFFQ